MSSDVIRPDYLDFEPGKQKEKQLIKERATSVRWFKCETKDLPGAIMSQAKQIIQSDRGRIDSYNTTAKLYGVWTPTFWNGYQLTNSGRPTAPMRERLTYNLIQSCIDTTTARIQQNKPKPMFLTSAGDSKLQRKAKKLDAYCYGQYYANNVYQLGPKVFRDSLIFGEGIMHVYSKNGKITFERVLPYEILVDYLESHYGPESTYSLFRIKNIDRTALAQEHPDQADAIMQMTGTSTFIQASSRSVSDTVTVLEAWRLPVGDEPGRHCIVTENSVLEDEDYTEDFFPFAIQRYCPRVYGFYAQGMAEQLIPSQVEINRTLISIQRSLYLGGTHKIFVKSGSKVIKSHFDNMIGTILEYAGDTMPQYVVPQLVQPEIYAHLNNMIDLGYKLPGVSQMSANSQKPLGLDSGKALRTYDDIQVQRFQTVAQNYEQFYVDLARITVAVSKKAYLEDKSLSVNVPGKRFIQQIKWSDVDMENDEFSLQIYPTSKLPQDPEGRLQSVQEMMQAGLITPEAGKRLLDYPDVEAEENLTNATTDYLHMILDDMVENGKFVAPEPFDNLDQAKALALEYYAQGKLNKLDESKLELLRRFLSQIDVLTTPPPQPMGGAPGQPGQQVPGQPGQTTAPQANPTPTPVSNLVPNVNGPQPGAPNI